MASKFQKLQDKHVLVIGGTSGIGLAVAEGSLAAGARVTVSSSNPARVESAVQRLTASFPSGGPAIAGYACDLSRPTIEQDLEALFAQVGTIDHLVFTAGGELATHPVSELTYERLVAAGQVRFFAALLAAKVGSRYLNPGPFSSIVFSSGMLGQKPSPDVTAVAGFAAAMEGITRSLAVDLKPVRVNLVAPGVVDTEIWDRLVASTEIKKEIMEGYAKQFPTGRVATPEDVAEAYLWLLKDPSVTGTIVNSNSGGLLI